MTHTFKAQKEILIDCHDSGISFHQKGGDDEDQFIHFDWNRVSELIEALEVMNDKWTESSIS